MCSLSREEQDVDDIVVTPFSTMAKVSCKKCQCQNGPCTWISVNSKDDYCETCFPMLLTHKFRATLGKCKLVRHGESVLVCHSGKANSTALLHLIKIGGNNSNGKRLPILAKVLHIDDGAAKGRTVEERKCMVRAVARQTKEIGLQGYAVSLNHSLREQFDTDVSRMDDFLVDSEGDADLRKVFDALDDDTSKDELLRRLRRKLVLSVAKKLGCEKVFFADTSLDLAAKVLGDVSVGRGARLSADVAFTDTRCADVVLLKPMKDFTENEVACYLERRGLTPVFSHPRCSAGKTFSASIRNVAYNFVQGLNSEFHGTVSTIRRTSEKLAAKSMEHRNTEIDTCVVCDVTLDLMSSHDEELSAIQATAFSKGISSSIVASERSRISEEAVDKNGQIEWSTDCRSTCKNLECPKKVCIKLSAEFGPIASDTMKYFFCYGCKRIFLDPFRAPEALPNFVLDRIQKRKRLLLMREEITDFLL